MCSWSKRIAVHRKAGGRRCRHLSGCVAEDLTASACGKRWLFVRTKELTEEEAELLCLLDIKNDSGDACTVKAVVGIISPERKKN